MASDPRRNLVWALTAVLAAVLVYRIAPYLRVYDVRAGDRAPAFSLVDDNGQGVSLSDYRGKWVLLNFWATWCPPCIEETPSLNRLHQELSGKGLVVLGVSVDESKEAYERFLGRFDITFPTVRDPEMTVNPRYGVNKFPESFLIDPKGYVVRRYVGPEDWMRPEVVNYLRSVL